MVKRYTAFPNVKRFDYFFECLRSVNLHNCWSKIDHIIDFENGILLTLMKLKQNFHYYHLAFLFDIPEQERKINKVFTYGLS
eukprot:Pgem_evm1s18974